MCCALQVECVLTQLNLVLITVIAGIEPSGWILTFQHKHLIINHMNHVPNRPINRI